MTNNKTIPDWVGFTGKAGVGKTRAARFMLCALKSESHKIILPFSFRIKEIAKDMGWDGNYHDCAKGRKLLQLLGTECGRQCLGEDVWIKAWHAEAERRWEVRNEPERLIVIADDVRFDNEAKFILDHGGIIIQVERGIQVKEFGGDKHASEQGIRLDLVTRHLNNEGSLHDLRLEVEELVDYYYV